MTEDNKGKGCIHHFPDRQRIVTFLWAVFLYGVRATTVKSTGMRVFTNIFEQNIY